MDEAAWLTGTNPTPMLRLLTDRASDRRLRLFLVASARMVWDELPDGELREAVEVAERYADGQASIDQVDDYRGRFYTHVLSGTREQRYWYRHLKPLWELARISTYPSAFMRTLDTRSAWEAVAEYHPAMPPLLRDIFGNPFRPVAFADGWRTATVRGLAEAIYADRVWDRLPILADALEEAGCDNADLLGHCRGPGPHVRGCWTVDLVLGKE